jgi:hypothetical protein
MLISDLFIQALKIAHKNKPLTFKNKVERKD